MVPVAEALAILTDPIDTNLEALAQKLFGIVSLSESPVHGVNDKLPVHRFLAVEEMAIEDKPEDIVLHLVASVDNSELQLFGK